MAQNEATWKEICQDPGQAEALTVLAWRNHDHEGGFPRVRLIYSTCKLCLKSAPFKRTKI